MKLLISFVVLCTAALFVTLDAAPTLPSGFEDAEVQKSDEIAKTFLNVFSNILSAASKNINPDDNMARSLLDGFSNFISAVGRKVNDGEIQSGDEMKQVFMNLLSSVLSGITKKIENGEVQSADKEIGRAFFNFMGTVISAAKRKADPNDELAQTFLNGFSTILSLIGKQFSEGGEIQSSDEMMQTLMNLETGEIQSVDEAVPGFLNLFSKILSVTSKNINPDDNVARSFFDGISNILSGFGGKVTAGNGEIQSDDEVVPAFLNLFSNFLSVVSKRVDPNDKLAQAVVPSFKKFFSVFAKQFTGGDLEIQSSDEMTQTVANLISSALSGLTKKIENGEIQSDDELQQAFLNLFGNVLSAAREKVDPNNQLAGTFLDGANKIISLIGRNTGGGQIQSDSELPRALLNLFGNVGSALQKKANPNDELSQSFFNLFNSMVSAGKSRIGGGQEVVVETLPYAAKHFDQRMTMESVDENAEMMEAFMKLSDEAKAQLWPMIIGSLASGL